MWQQVVRVVTTEVYNVDHFEDTHEMSCLQANYYLRCVLEDQWKENLLPVLKKSV